MEPAELAVLNNKACLNEFACLFIVCLLLVIQREYIFYEVGAIITKDLLMIAALMLGSYDLIFDNVAELTDGYTLFLDKTFSLPD